MKHIKIFIASPISGFENVKDYNIFRNKLLYAIKRLLRLDIVEDITCEILGVKNVGDYETPSISAQKDFKNISDCSHFVFIYPQKTITSAFIELGYAIALKKKILIIASAQKQLPYMAQELDKVYSNIQNHFFYSDDSNMNLYSIIKAFIE